MKISELKRIAEENDYEFYESLEYKMITLRRKISEDGFVTNQISINSNTENQVFIENIHCDEKDLNVIKAAIELAETPPEDRAEESFLTTKEFIEKVNNLGFHVEIIKDGNPSSPMYGKDSILKIWFEEELVAKIWLSSTYAINTFNEGHIIYRRGYDLNALYRLCFEYAGTPVDER